MSQTTEAAVVILTSKNLPLTKVQKMTIPAKGDQPERKGFSLGTKWLNGSDKFETREECYAALMGNFVTAAPSGKSLVCPAWSRTSQADYDFLAGILTARDTVEYSSEAVNLNDLA